MGLGHWRDEGLRGVLDAAVVRGLVMDGRGCWVVVVMGRVEGDIWGSVIGEGFVWVEELFRLGLGIAQVGGYVWIVGVLLLSVKIVRVVLDVGDSGSMVVGIFVGLVWVDSVVLRMVVVMGRRLGSVGMSVVGQIVMVHGWDLFEVAAVEVVNVRPEDRRFGGGLMRCVEGTRGRRNVASWVVGVVSRSLVVHEIVVRLGVVCCGVLVVAASVPVGFVRCWVLAAYDVRELFVVTMVMTVRLVDRSSLGPFGMVQPVAWLVVRSRLRLFVLVVGCVLRLLSRSVILLVLVARSACMVFVRVFRFKVTDYGVFVTKLVTNGGRTGTGTGTPTVVGTEFAVQFVKRTHSGDFCRIGIRIGWGHNIMIVIANVNDRWVAITVFVERDLGVSTSATAATA